MVVLRVLGPDDWADWRELRLSALSGAPEAFGARLADWQGEGDTEERWRARLSGGTHDLLAFVDGKPAGMVSGLRHGHGVELISLWVEPFARGRGVGDALVAAVLEWANGPVRLVVKAANHAAVALYRRHGFTDTGPSGVDERHMTRDTSNYFA